MGGAVLAIEHSSKLSADYADLRGLKKVQGIRQLEGCPLIYKYLKLMAQSKAG